MSLGRERFEPDKKVCENEQQQKNNNRLVNLNSIGSRQLMAIS